MIKYNKPPDASENDATAAAPADAEATSAKNFANLKKKVLQDHERLGLDSTFHFGCHPGVPCFNDCCSDVNIFLTPYDVIRVKNRLKITSAEFLSKYTVMPMHEKQKYPVIMLKMTEDEHKRCHFVDPEKGCTVYQDRPWACRMFPVGKASPEEGSSDEPFYFLMNEDVCHGWDETSEWTVRQWMDDQNVARWDEEGEKYKAITLHPYLRENDLTPEQMEMFYMVCFDSERFRRFVFESSLLQRIALDDKTVRKMRTSDAVLLDFGYKWLRFSLFREPVLQVKR
ncbi:YkgJ family cysteine cluster protein [bacterium]|nr:YkgJ family cysteine cluster protein [bacterium]